MSELLEPKRWLEAEVDDAHDSFADAIRAHCVSEGPSAEARARMWVGLAAQLPAIDAAATGVAGRSGSSSAPGADHVGRAVRGWWIAGACGVSFAAALIVFAMRGRPEPSGTVSAPAPVESRVREARGAGAEGAPPLEREPLPAAATSAEPPHVRSPQHRALVPKPKRAPAAAPAAKPVHSAPASERASPAPASSDVTSELRLLAPARRIVASDPARALEITAEHGRLHRFGLFAQEREVLAIEALRRLGHADLAAVRARRFVRDYPESAHRVQVLEGLEAP